MLMEMDRGRQFWRIVFGEERMAPTIPWEAPAVAVAPPAVAVAPLPPVAPLPTEDDLFARLSLDDLNKQAPLGDVYFDFDRSDLRPDGEATLQRNAAWLKRWPTTKVRIEGMADPRGTNDYNIRLGQRRSDTVRDYLVAQGIDPSRLESQSTGEENLFCTEQTEGCWARNRRGHFVFTAK